MSAATDATMIIPDSVLPERALRAMASMVKDRWRAGDEPDAARAVAELPALRYAKSIQLDLAYEEYCLRREAGECPDIYEFCERFPSLKVSLRRLLEAHELLEERPDLLEEQPYTWPEVGSQFLGFELLDELGRGAFARVYLARETALGNRLVALKVAPYGWGEADILGRLQHPNIVPIFSVTNDSDSPLTAVCMPYRGRATLCDVLDHLATLRKVPRKANAILDAIRTLGGTWNAAASPVESGFNLRGQGYDQAVVRIGALLAEALAYAHGLGIFHRDLKPSNVLLTPEGWPLLLDFNLAFDCHNMAHSVGGTLPYMAPEQLRATDPTRTGGSVEVGAKADLFSLGVILYELLTGQHPFAPLPEAGSLVAMRANLLERQRRGPTPLRKLRPDADKRLERLLKQLLAYAPQERPTAAEVAEALRQLLRPRSPWIPAVGTAIAVGVAALLGSAAYLGTEAHAPEHVGADAPTASSTSFANHLARGKAAYLAGTNMQAISEFSQAISSAESDTDRALAAFYRGRARQRLAIEHSDLKLLGLALTDYQMAEQIAPSPRNRACIGYCLCYVDPPQPMVAEGYFHQALEEKQFSAEVHNNLACIIGQDSERLWEALGHLDLAVEMKPLASAIRYNRAVVLYSLALQDTDEEQRQAYRMGAALSAVELLHAAVKDISKAIEVGPVTPEIHREAARILVRLAELDPTAANDARKNLKIALRQGVDGETVRHDLSLQPIFDQETKRLLDNPVPKQRRTLRMLDPLNGQLD
ncbi:MAG: serine/threonine protein kinase [Gemmatales bacterium]|nr:serine/threonine protein kinase [Gemmatales bacterium]MDW8387296.1 serine/threonine-protein kinase [Gemmatales bacterium]